MRRGDGRAWTLLVCVAIALCASPVRAQVAAAAPVPATRILDQLRVQPGVTCLNAEQLAMHVERWLEDAPVAEDVSIVVEGSVFDPRHVRLYIVADKRTIARRAFEPGPERCDHLHEAVALAIAMVLKAARTESQAPPPPEPKADTTAPVDSVQRWSLAGLGLATYGTLPALAPGLELSVRYELSNPFAVRLGVLGVAAFGVELGQGAFDATLVAARADACGRRMLTKSLHGRACVGLLGGMVRAVGTDVPGAQSSTVPALALAGAAELELDVSQRWSIALGLSASMLLHRVEVGLEDASGMRVHSRALSRLGFALGVGPAYHFE